MSAHKVIRRISKFFNSCEKVKNHGGTVCTVIIPTSLDYIHSVPKPMGSFCYSLAMFVCG